jgi:hypothetical protein
MLMYSTSPALSTKLLGGESLMVLATAESDLIEHQLTGI